MPISHQRSVNHHIFSSSPNTGSTSECRSKDSLSEEIRLGIAISLASILVASHFETHLQILVTLWSFQIAMENGH